MYEQMRIKHDVLFSLLLHSCKRFIRTQECIHQEIGYDFIQIHNWSSEGFRFQTTFHFLKCSGLKRSCAIGYYCHYHNKLWPITILAGNNFFIISAMANKHSTTISFMRVMIGYWRPFVLISKAKMLGVWYSGRDRLF